ncbi:hypothetical protein AGRO_5193 [Agrobacterium sp. ATCC 31749]|uniref:hypothetical protein n=1 Tax=unclassified Agrobacterium TaxID=2632611 RepID=UPI00020DBE67|nr:MULTISPECIES: hypothetical protein [unclassified Agrobacterium]EGL62119.1 hypothetical protein AGRO_5193 [Agrobacterium sp. ATCC 31749]QKX00479.1 hypothetical protein GSF67_25385 [Agrobacterium sp. CGMCC 11546]
MMNRNPLHKTFIAAIVVGIIVGGYEAYCYGTGYRKIAEFPDGHAGDTVAIAVDFDFAPETFNMNVLQQFGQLARADKNTVLLDNVKRDALIRLASNYWVADIRPWDKGA